MQSIDACIRTYNARNWRCKILHVEWLPNTQIKKHLVCRILKLQNLALNFKNSAISRLSIREVDVLRFGMPQTLKFPGKIACQILSSHC